ncbi:MAG TPA: right-handed parallel beta-helix repeat-containing protein, partial [Thermoanaerobaculia bacterium]|nr:right-handed parallel beta-helix repeat-containing protein [Thermoanaerobaculia bacterium]
MKRLPLVFLLFLLLARPLLADTAVSANITADTTWTAAGSPYIVTGNIAIGGPAGVTLTVNPGVTVKFATGSQLLVNSSDKGALVANGTSADPILFTSNVSATAGAWLGLRFGTIAGAPASSVSYATVEYAGSNFSGFGGITVHGGSPSFDHVTARVNQYAGIKIENGAPSIAAGTIRDNGGYGIYLTGGAATLTDDTFTSNTSVAASAPANTQLSGMTGLAATGNGTNGVEFRDGTIAANRTWKTCALPYIVTGNIYVQDASAPVLTIEAGNTVRFNNSGQITANYQNKGGIVAAGTSTAPILLTSNAASPAAGNWLGLYFGSFAGGPASALSYTTIEYGGNTYNSRGGVTVYTQSPAFDHATIRNNAWGGVAVYGGSPSFTDTTFVANGGAGINVLNPATLTLTNDTFTSNSGFAVTAPAPTIFTDNSGLAATGNTGGNYLEIRGGTIAASTTWPLSPIAYVVTGNLYVEGASSPILTIAAGNTIRFNNPGQIAVNNTAKGGLQAIGTAAAPILFTSNGTQS